MPSEIMQKVAETERLCDEKRAGAKAAAGELVAEAEKKAAAMKKEAAAYARAKSDAILRAAQTQADRLIADGAAADAAETAALRAECEPKMAEAVRQTALWLLEHS